MYFLPLAVLCAAAALAVAWPGASRAQEAGVKEAQGGTPSTTPPPGREDPEPVRPVDLKPQEGIRAQAEVPTFTVFKDFNAWWGDNMDARTLGAMGRTLGLDWSNQMVPYCGNTGVPEGTDVAVFTSNSEGRSSTTSAQTSAACQANLEKYLGTGGTLIVDMGDNDYYGGFFAPGSKGTPTLRFPDNWSDATLTAEAKGQDGRLGTEDDHPLVKGPDGQAGTSDDLTDSNIDACCYVAHGNLQDGVALPAGATPLVTAAFGGVQKPIVAEYGHAGGHVIVDTVTKEFSGQQRTPTGEGRFIRNLFEYAQNVRGGGNEPPAEPKGRSYVAIGDSTTTGHGIASCGLPPAPGFEYEHGCPDDEAYKDNARPYPELIANELGEPYTDLERVGVYGYTMEDAAVEYDEAGKRGDERRADGDDPPKVTPWKSQLHAVDDAEDLVTMTMGVNDIGFPTVTRKAGLGADNAELVSYVEEQLNKKSVVYDVDKTFERLTAAKDRGAVVVLSAYNNPVSNVGDQCDVLYNAGGITTGLLNYQLRTRAEAGGLGVAELQSQFQPNEGPLYDQNGNPDMKTYYNHGAGGPAPWVFGDNCEFEDVAGLEPGGPEEPGGDANPLGPKEIDPHPNRKGDEAIAKAFVEEIKEWTR